MDKFPGYLTYKCRKVWFRTKIVVVHNKVWVTVFIGVDYCFATSQGCSIFGILFASKMSAGGTLWTGGAQRSVSQPTFECIHAQRG